MEKMYAFIFLICLIFFDIEEVMSLRCYSCIDGYSNANCNSKGEITCSSNSQVCYTEISKTYFVVKRYTKGCMESSECYQKMDLNEVMACSETPSTCTYCCPSDLCNAANQANHLTIRFTSRMTLVAAVMSLYLCQ